MSKLPFESQNALHQFFSQSSLEEFRKTIPSLAFPDLVEGLTILQTQPTENGKNKLEHVFSYVTSGVELESLSKHFSPESFLCFLEFIIKQPQFQDQLTFVLIGLPPSVFSQALHLLTEKHLILLQIASKIEPLQYQLTQFYHEGETLKQHVEQRVQLFKQELLTIMTEQMTPDLLQNLIGNIDHLRNLLIDYLERASAALAIVWHTDRIDLIEKLSSMNESIQHQLSHLIGHSAFDHLPASGLYAFLEQNLSNIFDSTLNDDDAAIEGMTRLSVWHLKDYAELGLLPSMQSHDKELVAKQTLNSLVQVQLERLGIGKVRDLKKFHLFSKYLLKDYIEKHYDLLLKTPSI